jgi:hypothetical protein
LCSLLRLRVHFSQVMQMHARSSIVLVVVSVAMGAGCRDGRSWRSAFRDYARPDTVERLHVVLQGERARNDTVVSLNKALETKNQYLLIQLNDLARTVNEIDQDLASLSHAKYVRPLMPRGELENDSTDRALLDTKRQRIAANLDRLKNNIQTTDSLWRSTAAEDAALRAELSTSGETLEMFKSLAATRAIQFAEMEDRIDSLEIANHELVTERDRMRDSLSRLSARVRRVYYVVGTRSELMEAGILREMTVARKTWKGWQRERHLVPAREAELARIASTHSAAGSLGSPTDEDDEDDDVRQQGQIRHQDFGEFREIDRFRDTVIVLPSVSRGRLRVISGQELRYADGVGREGKIAAGGRLRIVDPEGFWEGGRFLVLVLDR